MDEYLLVLEGECRAERRSSRELPPLRRDRDPLRDQYAAPGEEAALVSEAWSSLMPPPVNACVKNDRLRASYGVSKPLPSNSTPGAALLE